MTTEETYLIDGRQVSAEECKRIFANEKLGDRQSKVLDWVEGDVVVDVGCYSGFFISQLAAKYPNKKSVGVDYFDDNIRIAKLVRPELSERFRKMSAYKLEFGDASIDCVTLQEVLEHLEGAAHATKEINRVLKKGGVLIVSVPNPFYVSAMLGFFRFELRNGLRRLLGGKTRLGNEIFFEEIEWNRHIFSWTPQTLLTLFVVNGFEYVEHCYEGGMPNLIERYFLKLFPFMGPTQILKVRKVNDASAAIV